MTWPRGRQTDSRDRTDAPPYLGRVSSGAGDGDSVGEAGRAVSGPLVGSPSGVWTSWQPPAPRPVGEAQNLSRAAAVGEKATTGFFGLHVPPETQVPGAHLQVDPPWVHFMADASDTPRNGATTAIRSRLDNLMSLTFHRRLPALNPGPTFCVARALRRRRRFRVQPVAGIGVGSAGRDFS